MAVRCEQGLQRVRAVLHVVGDEDTQAHGRVRWKYPTQRPSNVAPLPASIPRAADPPTWWWMQCHVSRLLPLDRPAPAISGEITIYTGAVQVMWGRDQGLSTRPTLLVLRAPERNVARIAEQPKSRGQLLR